MSQIGRSQSRHYPIRRRRFPLAGVFWTFWLDVVGVGGFFVEVVVCREVNGGIELVNLERL